MPQLPQRIRISAPHIEQRIHRALVEGRRAEVTEPGVKLRLSAIGGCERNLWAEANGIAAENDFSAQTLAIFALGKAIEEHVLELLYEAGFLISRQQETIVAFGGLVIGHLDGVIRMGRKDFEDRDAVLEIKSAKKERFEDLVSLGYELWSPEYADQLHAYMGFAEIPEALALVYCKDDSRIYAETIRKDRDRFKALWQKAKRIVSSEEVLPRPDRATSQYCGFCKYCDRQEWCWSPIPEAGFDA